MLLEERKNMFFRNFGLIEILYYFIIFAFSISVHESAHAYIAYRLGDNTGKDLGRITINPMKHLDVTGTILLFFAGFGWAKPVPINPSNFKNRKVGTVMVSLAGPLSNFILAFIFAFIFLFLQFKFDVYSNFTSTEPLVVISNFSIMGLSLNILLTIFNLLPFPPLDGSKVFTFFLPQRYYFRFMQYQYATFIIFIILIYTGILRVILIPAQEYTLNFIFFVLKPVINLIT
jgi:Zn-dependent protease